MDGQRHAAAGGVFFDVVGGPLSVQDGTTDADGHITLEGLFTPGSDPVTTTAAA